MPSANNPGNRSLPKFGEWDVNNPAAGEGFTVIFNKARDQKKTNGNATASTPPVAEKSDKKDNSRLKKSPRKWFCWFFGK